MNEKSAFLEKALFCPFSILLSVREVCLPIHDGSPLANEVIAFLGGGLGFAIYDIYTYSQRPLDGELAQSDILFARTDLDLFSKKGWPCLGRSASYDVLVVPEIGQVLEVSGSGGQVVERPAVSGRTVLGSRLSTVIKRWSDGPFISSVKATIRAMQQERKAASELRGYHTRARQMGTTVPSPGRLRTLLAQRLGSRRKTLKQKGDLSIFVAYAVRNWEQVLPLALKSLGSVSEFEWRRQGYDDGRADWAEQRDRMNRDMLRVFQEAQRRRPIDVVVGYLSGHNMSPETLQEMTKAGAVVLNFCWDDKLNFPGPIVGGRYISPAAIAHAVDLNLTNSPDSVIKYMVHGGLAMFWPEAAHPEIHRPYEVPFEFDVSFVGACYGWRPTFIRALCKRGIHVECFGNSWPNGPLSDTEMVRLYSRSRVNLGFAGVGHSRRLMCLKARDFEVPMSGGLYMTQDNPELSLVYEVGSEIVTYTDADDCAEKIKRLLDYPDEAEQIRRAGRARALKDHTWERRFRDAFDVAGVIRSADGDGS